MSISNIFSIMKFFFFYPIKLLFIFPDFSEHFFLCLPYAHSYILLYILLRLYTLWGKRRPHVLIYSEVLEKGKGFHSSLYWQFLVRCRYLRSIYWMKWYWNADLEIFSQRLSPFSSLPGKIHIADVYESSYPLDPISV